jgi:hypothetical protein
MVRLKADPTGDLRRKLEGDWIRQESSVGFRLQPDLLI